MNKLVAICSLIAPVLSAAPLCTTFSSTPPTANSTGVIPYSAWAAPGFSCSFGDKTIAAIDPGAAPADTSLTIANQPLPGMANYIVTFNGSFIAPYILAYNIFIDATAPSPAPPGTLISNVGLDENAPAIGATAQVTTTVRTGSQAGPVVGTLTVTPSAKPAPAPTNATSLFVSNAFTGTGAVSFSDAFTQTLGVPEPASMILIGSGLALASLALRRRRSLR